MLPCARRTRTELCGRSWLIVRQVVEEGFQACCTMRACLRDRPGQRCIPDVCHLAQGSRKRWEAHPLLLFSRPEITSHRRVPGGRWSGELDLIAFRANLLRLFLGPAKPGKNELHLCSRHDVQESRRSREAHELAARDLSIPISVKR